MRDRFTEMLAFRNATKLFKNEKVLEEDLKFILEAGRMAPSSFGIEPWKFLVVSSLELKQKLQAASFNQPQIASASSVIVILVRKELFIEEGYVEPKLRAIAGDGAYESVYKDFYIGYTQEMNRDKIIDWADKQCHMAGMNMMNAAAFLKLDTCPIGGFIPNEVEAILDIDTSKYTVSMLLPVGYRANNGYEKTRMSFDEAVEYVG